MAVVGGISIGRVNRKRLPVSGYAVSVAPILAAINADGWSFQYTNTPSSLNPMDDIPITTNGYNSSAAPITFTETIKGTQRVRQLFDKQATLTDKDVAGSDHPLASDTAPGVTNNSPLVMPVPIANWVMQSRRVVGNTIRVGVTGNHWSARNGRPFVCVEFTATDGTTTTAPVRVSTMTVSTTGAGDLHAVLAYEADIDVSGLANPADITINAKVYPWRGSAVADSSTGTGAREFSPRVFRRDTAKAALPNLVRVASGGNDTTGYVGTDPALALASPCATLTGAINRARAVLGATTGALDGLRVQLTEGTWALTASPTANTVNHEVVIEPAPGAAKANTILQFGASNFVPNLTYLRYRGLTLSRTGAFYIYNGAVGFCVIEDCVLNATSTATLVQTNGSVIFWNGVVIPGATGTMLASSNVTHGMIRGVDNQTSVGNFHGKLVLGSRFRTGAVYDVANAAQAGTFWPQDNTIIQFSSFRLPSAANAVVGLDSPITGFSFSQNLIEVTHTTTSTPSFRPSSDSRLNNLTHVLFDNVTVACAHFQAGRGNIFYDETIGTVRTHVFCRVSRSVAGGLYIKGDVFVGTNGNGTPNPTDAPTHIGNRAQIYGTGFRDNLTLFAQSGTNTVGAAEGFAYPGTGSSIPSGTTTPQISLADGVNFTAWRATTTNATNSTAVAGTGDGDYSYPAGSALLGRVSATAEYFPRGLDGALRDRGAIGAYA